MCGGRTRRKSMPQNRQLTMKPQIRTSGREIRKLAAWGEGINALKWLDSLEFDTRMEESISIGLQGEKTTPNSCIASP